MYETITPIHNFNGVYVKREDLAFWHSLDHPSGSKVRQYGKMHSKTSSVPGNEEAPCIVGCSANSCQQVYVASTANLMKIKGIIYVPKRATKTAATKYCEQLGSEIVEVKPGYLSVVRKHTRQRIIDLKKVIEWDRKLAILDTAEQCVNITKDIKRVIVPTGSGLTAAGVLIGISNIVNLSGWNTIEVVAVATSPMVVGSKIRDLAKKYNPYPIELGPLCFIPPTVPYDKYIIGRLPDNTPLDPFYAAKSWHLADENDLFWPPGLRPIRAMPEDCQEVFRDWEGPVES